MLSLWQGSSCTGTFRLPVQDAARLIGALADSLADAAARPLGAESASAPKKWSDTFRGWFRRRRQAPVLPLTIVRGP